METGAVAIFWSLCTDPYAIGQTWCCWRVSTKALVPPLPCRKNTFTTSMVVDVAIVLDTGLDAGVLLSMPKR